MINIKKGLFVVVAVLLSFLSGCGDQKTSIGDQDTSVKDESSVLARANEFVITQRDFDENINRMLGEYQASLLDESGRQQALKSMVISRVMAQQAQKELSKDQLAGLERQAADYKEKLLVNQYLKTYAKVEPVTNKMVKEYYDQHPEKYGAHTIKRYEMIYTEEKISSNQRNSLFNMLNGAEKQKDWKVLTSRIQKKGMKVYYREGNADDSVLNKKIKDLMNSLNVKEFSKTTIIDGRLYLVRITKELQKIVRPLSEVGAEIRKSLVPVKLKKAIKAVSDEILKKVHVEYSK